MSRGLFDTTGQLTALRTVQGIVFVGEVLGIEKVLGRAVILVGGHLAWRQ
jgi:hypothetical protein